MPQFLDLHGKTTKSLRAAAEAALRRHGLRLGQDHLLAALWERDGRTPGDIAVRIGVTTPAVTKATHRLTELGLIERRDDEHDNRLIRLWLTESGRALQDPVETERRHLEETVTAQLTEAERRHLLSALTKIDAAARTLIEETSGLA